MEEAVCCDTAGDYEKAISLYTKSLNHFMAAIHCEWNVCRQTAWLHDLKLLQFLSNNK